jgi:CRP-like cAMP-binding protein
MSDFFSYQGKAEPVPAAPAPPAALPGIGAGLDEQDWEHVIRFAARRRFPVGAVLVSAGDTDRALHFIASGQVELRGPGPARSVRGEGEVFGVLSFLDGEPSAVTAVVAASGPAELLRITPDTLQQLSAWQPRIALALMRDMGAQVAARLRRVQPVD